jgi:hypothetical protein
MSFIKNFRNGGALSILNKFSEAKIAVTYKAQTNGVEDFEAGKAFVPEYDDYANVVAFRKKFKEEDKDLGITTPEIVEFTIIANTLQVEPNALGKILYNGDIWNIKKVESVPIDFPVKHVCLCVVKKG